MQMTLAKAIPPRLSIENGKYQLVIGRSSYYSACFDPKRFVMFIDLIPDRQPLKVAMFEHLNRDEEFIFPSAIPIPEEVVREFTEELEPRKSRHTLLDLQ